VVFFFFFIFVQEMLVRSKDKEEDGDAEGEGVVFEQKQQLEDKMRGEASRAPQQPTSLPSSPKESPHKGRDALTTTGRSPTRHSFHGEGKVLISGEDNTEASHWTLIDDRRALTSSHDSPTTRRIRSAYLSRVGIRHSDDDEVHSQLSIQQEEEGDHPHNDLEAYAGDHGEEDEADFFGMMNHKPLSKSASDVPLRVSFVNFSKGKEEDDEDEEHNDEADYLNDTSSNSSLSRSQEISSTAFEQQRRTRIAAANNNSKGGRNIPVPAAFDIKYTSLNADLAGSDGYLAGTPSDNMMKEDITGKRFLAGGPDPFGDSIEKREQTEAVSS